MSIISINSILTKCITYPSISWPSIKVKTFSTIGTSVSAIDVSTLSVGLYCKYFQKKKELYT